MRSRAMIGLVTVPAFAACQPTATDAASSCDLERPAPGEVVVARLSCADLVPPDGEGRPDADLYLATHELRAILRHPQDALTVAGAGGGTLVDVAPWEGPDVVHEVVPQIDGAWLVDLEATVLSDRIELEGTDAAGERRTVTWRAEGPWLVAEGADALRIDPLGDAEVLGGLVLSSPTVVGAVGAVTDLGVLTVDGTDRLLVATDSTAWPALAGSDGARISGVADGAERLTLLSSGAPVGRVPVSGPFDLVVPAEVDGVRADAVGFASSPAVAPGEGLALTVGGRGVVRLEPEHRVLATWTDLDGRPVTVFADEQGADLPLGAGVHPIHLSGGPLREPADLTLDVQGDQTLPVSLPARLDPTAWSSAGATFVLASFARPADRSPEWRGSDTTAVRRAAGEGLAYATFAPTDSVSDTTASVWGRPPLLARDGSSYAGPGWRASAWSFASSDRKALHGAVPIPGLGAADAAAAVNGDGDRTLLVDLGWLAEVGPPHRIDPQPDLVLLDRGDPASWDRWFDWLDAGRALVPVGPYAWLPVADPDRMGAVDVEQPLFRGLVCAGNGPLVELTVDGLAPGEVLPDDAEPVHTVHVEVRGEVPTHLALFTSAGAVDVVSGRNLVALDGSWVVAAAWSDDPLGPWAVTGPVWLRAPSRPPPSPPPR